jgi:hypothetical protein
MQLEHLEISLIFSDSYAADKFLLTLKFFQLNNCLALYGLALTVACSDQLDGNDVAVKACLVSLLYILLALLFVCIEYNRFCEMSSQLRSQRWKL